MSTAYAIRPRLSTLSHYRQPVHILGDFSDEHRRELHARVASGDYFLMLATQLDDLSQQLAETDPSAQHAVDHLITDLDYLHARYKIIRRSIG